MNTRLFRHDDGYSIAELLVTMAIMGVVVSAAYALLHLAGVSATQSDRQAWIASEIGKPLEGFERSFMQQAPPVESPEAFTCTIRTDQDRDNHPEIHVYTATADGLLTEAFSETVDSPVPHVRTWSHANANVVAGVPLFRYFDSDRQEILQDPLEDLLQYQSRVEHDARSIEITIVTEHDDQQFSDSRRVYFRNQ